jgi:hypothetical protein
MLEEANLSGKKETMVDDETWTFLYDPEKKTLNFPVEKYIFWGRKRYECQNVM